ncbi:uncharacterized protein LOC133498883 [Syngnathoides biaculeatus]|uniref:uncharacterized protein LOC133498883 n=1 Tax=Syngnathoides biaculeatus TaxID=300417 RepID=UPI002ADDE878|nr:uncharacterized protein LOC133498883 [Syngnathoides biaculeatus]
MPAGEEKTKQRAAEETKDVDDEDSEAMRRIEKSAERHEKKRKDGELESASTDVRIGTEKPQADDIAKKKKTSKKASGDDLGSPWPSTDDEDHHHHHHHHGREDNLPDVIVTAKCSDYKMGSKEQKSKEEEKAAGDEEKKKDKTRKTKGSGNSDEDVTKTKGKRKKKKKKNVENYVEIYERELRNCQLAELVDNCQDEYHKKKVYEVTTVTGDERGAGTDAKGSSLSSDNPGSLPKSIWPATL